MSSINLLYKLILNIDFYWSHGKAKFLKWALQALLDSYHCSHAVSVWECSEYLLSPSQDESVWFLRLSCIIHIELPRKFQKLWVVNHSAFWDWWIERLDRTTHAVSLCFWLLGCYRKFTLGPVGQICPDDILSPAAKPTIYPWASEIIDEEVWLRSDC